MGSAAGCSAADGAGGSGVAGGCAVQVTGGTANGVGTYAFTATARDAAGNGATRSGSYRVVYRVSTGTAFWQQPINDTAHTAGATTSVFKAGSTVPAKFRITDAAGRAVRTNAAPAWLVPVKGSAMSSPIDETVSALSADSGATFRWTDEDQQYIYNWGTAKNQAGFYWRVGVRLDDGSTHTISIGLR